MTAERVTVSLPTDTLQEARGRVDAGAAPSMSAYVADALREKMDRTRALDDLERVGRRPSAEALAAVRRDWGLGPAGAAAAARAGA
jgi:Arc/MetJ-type ribon-helix-helix transcriptional regulator